MLVGGRGMGDVVKAGRVWGVTWWDGSDVILAFWAAEMGGLENMWGVWRSWAGQWSRSVFEVFPMTLCMVSRWLVLELGSP